MGWTILGWQTYPASVESRGVLAYQCGEECIARRPPRTCVTREPVWITLRAASTSACGRCLHHRHLNLACSLRLFLSTYLHAESACDEYPAVTFAHVMPDRSSGSLSLASIRSGPCSKVTC